MTVLVDIVLGIIAFNALIVVWAFSDIIFDAIRDLDDRIRLSKFERRYHRQMDALERAWLLDPPSTEHHA